LANIGKRIAVKVIVRTTSGRRSVGVETLSAKTAVVTGAPPEGAQSAHREAMRC
jgi:hypothetical protein